jgi:hypothetical protein
MGCNNPAAISLRGRLYRCGPKIKNISRNIVAKGGVNAITYLKMEIGDVFLHDVKIVHDAVDSEMVVRIQVDDLIYFVYKFLKVKTLKRIMVYRGNIKNQWSVLYDVGDGIFYSDEMEIKDIGQNLMAVWTVKMEKIFKIGIEGSIKATSKEDRMCTFGELIKETKRYYGLGKDAVFMNLSSEEYNKLDIAYYKKKDIWIGKQRYGRKPKSGKIIDKKASKQSIDYNVESVDFWP